MTVPKPIRRWAYLERAMGCVTRIHGGCIRQHLGLSNGTDDRRFGIFNKHIMVYFRFEKQTRFVSAGTRNFLKSLDSDVGTFQE